MTEITSRRDGAEAFSLWSAEDAVGDFTLYQVAENISIIATLSITDPTRWVRGNKQNAGVFIYKDENCLLYPDI